jgi:hypothetical protein
MMVKAMPPLPALPAAWIGLTSISRSGGDERGLSREAKRSQTHPAGHAQRG